MGTNLPYVRVLLSKEFKDLIRDRKTLFTTILLPLIMLPLLGFVGIVAILQQPVNVSIVDQDSTSYVNSLLNLSVSSKWLLENLTAALSAGGFNVSTTRDPSVIEDPRVDVVVVIPEGFSANASSLNSTARVTVYRKAGYQSALRAESSIYSVISSFSHNISRLKIDAVARLARINATYASLRNPVEARTEIVTVEGEPAPAEYELKALLARLLVLAFSFAVAPAASYVIDGIIGERERKTIEFLLVSPAPLSHIIYSKMVMATFLGIIAAVVDSAGLIIYMALLGLAVGAGLFMLIDYGLLLVHAVTAFFTILSTIAIALPFITRTKGIRSASNIANIVTTAAIVLFLSGFFVDYVKLPAYILYPLYAIPFVHSVLAIQLYMLESLVGSAMHIAYLAAFSLSLLIISTKTISTEKLIVAST